MNVKKSPPIEILVTGSAGFIGFHLCKKLLENGLNVVGIDNLNSYYDVNLKISRNEHLKTLSKPLGNKYIFLKGNIEDNQFIEKSFLKFEPQYVVNLAAQAGVRYSIENPQSYISSNLVGFGNILENCKEFNVKHLIYASSSSVYGGNALYPFSEMNNVDHPVSLYAATKKSNEIMAHSYSHLFKLPTTGLRFFTVYGPWGRPDMALFKFTKAILDNKEIEIYNNGDMIRDFTFIDDVVEGIIKVIKKIATPDKNFNKLNPKPGTSWSPYRIFNIGNSNAINLMEYIECIENILGKKAIKKFMPMQPGDVRKTISDTSSLEDWINFRPQTPVEVGVKLFIDWYRKYFKI